MTSVKRKLVHLPREAGGTRLRRVGEPRYSGDVRGGEPPHDPGKAMRTNGPSRPGRSLPEGVPAFLLFVVVLWGVAVLFCLTLSLIVPVIPCDWLTAPVRWVARSLFVG